MRTIVVALLVSGILAGCSIPSRIKNVKKCTLGCGEFEFVVRDGVTYAKTVKTRKLVVPRFINERPEERKNAK